MGQNPEIEPRFWPGLESKGRGEDKSSTNGRRFLPNFLSERSRRRVEGVKKEEWHCRHYLLPVTGDEVQGLTFTKYIKIGTELIASKRDGVGKLFYHNDHLGGVNFITDIFGVMVQLDEYDPCEKVSERGERISLTHAFCFSRLASDIRGLTPLKRFESCFQDLQESAGDFSNDLHNDFSLGAQPF